MGWTYTWNETAKDICFSGLWVAPSAPTAK